MSSFVDYEEYLSALGIKGGDKVKVERTVWNVLRGRVCCAADFWGGEHEAVEESGFAFFSKMCLKIA